MPVHLPSASTILQKCGKVNEKTTAIKHMSYLFSLVQANFPLRFCLCSLRSQSALLEEIPSNPVGFFYFEKPFGSCQCAALHLPRTESLYITIVQSISGLKQHISFISSQKIPQNPDRYCVCGNKPLDSLFCGFLSVGEARHTIQLSGVSTFSILYRHSVFFFFFFT